MAPLGPKVREHSTKSKDGDSSITESLEIFHVQNEDARRRFATPEPQEENEGPGSPGETLLATPTSEDFAAEIEKVAPSLLDQFRRFAEDRARLAQGWHDQYEILKQEKDQRIQGIYFRHEEDRPTFPPSTRPAARRLLLDSEIDSSKYIEVARTAVEQQMTDDRGFYSMPPGGPAEPRGLDEEAVLEARAQYAAREARLTEQLFSPVDSKSSPTSIKRKTTWSPRPSSNEGSVNEIRVKIRLLPAIVLISTLPSDVDVLHKAQELARSAWALANRSNVSKPLVARCSFYIGMCRYVLRRRDSIDNTASRWFVNALEANTGGYEEGRLAALWLEFLQTPQVSPSASERPADAGSWVAGMWKAVRGFTSGSAKAVPLDGLRAEVDKDVSPKHAQMPGPAPRTVRGEDVPDVPGRMGEDYDHQGLNWSPTHPFAKGTILPATDERDAILFELVESPDRLTGFTDDDEEVAAKQQLPHNTRGGFVNNRDMPGVPQAFIQKQAVQQPTSPYQAVQRQALQQKRPRYRVVNGAPSNSSRSASAAQPSKPEASYPAPPTGRQALSQYQIVNGAPTNSSSSAASSAIQSGKFNSPDKPETSGTSPQVSPRKSVAFSAVEKASLPHEGREDSGEQLRGLSSRGNGLLNRRRLSNMLADIATGRASKASDELGLAEEGRSPAKPKPEEKGIYKRKSRTP